MPSLISTGGQSLLNIPRMTSLSTGKSIRFAGHGMKSARGGKTCQGCPKFRFPLRCGHVSSCPYEAECSPGIYRRTVYIKNHADLRFHSSTPRDSEQYMAVYCEQVINRILNDYCLQHLKIRGKDHFF